MHSKSGFFCKNQRWVDVLEAKDVLEDSTSASAFGRKICDFGQKKPSDFGEGLFFWRSPAFGRKICDFGQKSLRISAKTFFFGDHLLL